MPLEIDDQSIRIIGNNFKGLKFYDDLRTLQQEIYLKSDNTLNIGGSTGGSGGSGGMEAHAIDGVLHVGTLADVQGPQFMLLDGTRAMTAALDMGTFNITNVGTVDGVDVSAHAARHAAAGGDPVDHDALTNFVADEHIAHSGVTLTAGAGLTGGGTIAASRTFAVGAGTLITVSADAVGITDGANYQFIGTGAGTAAAWQNLSTLAGAGLTHSAGILAVGAGTMITVNADDVQITAGANYQFIGTGAGTAAAWQNLSALAGAGLTHSAGVLAVGAGTLITVGADTVGLSVGTAEGQAIVTGASPFTPAYSTTPTWAGLHTFNAGIDVNGTLEFQGAQSITSTTGNMTMAPAGDVILDPTGNDVLPNQNYDINLGMLSKKYLTLHCAELWVETLVAQETIATIGGRILVGPTTTLTSDLAAGDTTIYVKHNQMASGDRVYLEADGKVEFMAITGAPGGSGPYSYTVTRNLDGTGANTWYAGDAVFNTGTTGDGFIDLYSIRGVKSATQYGPTIVGNVRNSATFNDWTEVWAIGNLNGLYGYGVDTYGVGLGKYSAADYITIDPTNGIRFLDAADVVQAQLSSSVWTLGRVAASFSNVQITAGAIKLRTNTTDHVELTTAGTFWAGDTNATERIQWDTTNGLRIYDANNAAVFTSSPTGVTWLSTLAISESLGQSLFSSADGLLLLGPGCAITPTSWTSTRGQVATISGAFHQVQGRWADSKALAVEAGATNIVTNPSFEVNATTFWTTYNGTSAISSDYAVFGSHSCKLAANDSNDPYIYKDTAIASPAAGSSYTGTAYVRGYGATIGKTARIHLRETGGAQPAATSETVVTLTGSWQRITVTRTIVEADRTGLDFWIRIYCNNTEYGYIDGVQLEGTAVATSYCDGTLGQGYAWSGTPHASTSTRTATEVNLDTSAAVLSGQATLSMSFWLQAGYAANAVWPRRSGYDYVLDAFGDISNRILLAYDETDDKWSVYLNGSERFQSSAQTFSAGDWLHVVLTLDYSSDEYALYVNGVLDGSGTPALTVPTIAQINLGSAYDADYRGGFAFGEYAVFGRVLTAEEVAALYAAGRPLQDMGAFKRPGVYILDGEFDLRSSQTGARVQIDSTGIAGYSADTTKTFSLETDGDLFLGSNISAVGTTALAVFANAQTYNSESMGAGDVLLGDNSAGKINLLWDVSEGDIILRRGNGAGAARITLDGSADSILIGQAAASQNNVLISSGAISIRNNTTERIGVTAAGILTIKDSAGNAVITLDASSGAEITKKLTLPGANSAIAIGSTPPTAHNAGTGIWIDRTGLFALDAGTYQVKVDATDGKLYAGAGNIFLDSDGVSVALGTGRPNGVCWVDGIYVRGKVWTYAPSAVDSYINLGAFGEAGGSGYLILTVSDNDFFQTETVTLSTSMLSSSVPLDVTGDVWCSGQISTDGGTTQWDLGAYSAGAPTADGYVSVVINGSTYKLLCDKV